MRDRRIGRANGRGKGDVDGYTTGKSAHGVRPVIVLFHNLSHGDGLGLNERALQLAAANPSARIEATVWIDDRGLIVQVMRTLVGATDIAASTVTRLADFGTSAAIAPPIE